MADHDELVAEMLALEQMGTQERQKLAKKRRIQQLKKWGQREKEWLAKEKQLNRRLANRLNEENNGLNLKQYTTYNSNQRAKKRPPASDISATASAKSNTTVNGNNNCRYTNGSNGTTKMAASGDKRDEKLVLSHTINNNTLTSIDGPYANNLSPNGRVHFDVGVMLLEAAARNDYDEVKRLLTLGVSPDSVNHDGLTALHQCCIDASEPIMNLLLEFGADVDARDTERWTPLHAACTCGHLNLVKILVAHEADLLAVNGDGNMPFDICEDESTLDYIESQMIKRGITQEMIDTMRSSNEIQMHKDLEQLIASGKDVDLNSVDKDGATRLHIAAANNYISVVRLLLEHGANVNVCDNDLWRPLHGVACWGNEQHIKMAEMLVEGGADLEAKTSNDETVFDLCDNVELLERLNQLKDELESKRGNGTDRLRRTQSRTNSRVHSVRRTRVQDKNQISRREAREEAMLRVESSENLNASDQQPAAPTSGQSDSNNHSENQEIAQTGQNGVSRPGASQVPSETNLDLISLPNGTTTTLSNGFSSQTVGQDQVDSIENEPTQTKRSQQEQHNSYHASQQQQQKHQVLQHEQTTSSPSEQPTLKNTTSNSVTTMRVSAAISPRKVQSEILTSADDKMIPQPDNGVPGPQTTSIVQVHFTPMNYTLANLKKHRSEVRMRTAVIGRGGPSVQQEPEPTTVLLDTSSEWSSGRSGAASFNKFHGEPSDTIEYRQSRYKCCTII